MGEARGACAFAAMLTPTSCSSSHCTNCVHRFRCARTHATRSRTRTRRHQPGLRTWRNSHFFSFASPAVSNLNKKIVENQAVQTANARMSPGMMTSQYGCLEDIVGCMCCERVNRFCPLAFRSQGECTLLSMSLLCVRAPVVGSSPRLDPHCKFTAPSDSLRLAPIAFSCKPLAFPLTCPFPELRALIQVPLSYSSALCDL